MSRNIDIDIEILASKSLMPKHCLDTFELILIPKIMAGHKKVIVKRMLAKCIRQSSYAVTA